MSIIRIAHYLGRGGTARGSVPYFLNEVLRGSIAEARLAGLLELLLTNLVHVTGKYLACPPTPVQQLVSLKTIRVKLRPCLPLSQQ